MKHFTRVGAVLGAFAATLVATAAAGAAGMTITGDDGRPLALTEGAPATVRQMKPHMMPTFSGSEGRYSLGVTDPEGRETGGYVSCREVTSPVDGGPIDYAGNGTYTVTLYTYADPADDSCLQPTTTQAYRFTIDAHTALLPPSGVLLTTKPYHRRLVHRFQLDVNPGADTYDVKQVSGPPGYASDGDTKADGEAEMEFDRPGTYTLTAVPEAGGVPGPASAPLTVKVLAPFDLHGSVFFQDDAQWPKFKLKGLVYDAAMNGQRIAVAIAKGQGEFRPLTTAKVKDLDFVFTFTQRARGKYRLRYSFKGSTLVAPGAWVQKVTLGRESSSSEPVYAGS